MPSRRDVVRMTPEEVRSFLETQRRIILITNGANGMPHAVPMNFGVDEQGRLLLTSFARSQKVRNLERDARATLLVESGEQYGELRSVMMHAAAEIIRDPVEVAPLMGRIRAADVLSSSIDDGMSQQVRASLSKRVVLRFAPFHVVSWDHSKLAGKY